MFIGIVTRLCLYSCLSLLRDLKSPCLGAINQVLCLLSVEFGVILEMEFHMDFNIALVASLVVGVSLLGGTGQQPFFNIK